MNKAVVYYHDLCMDGFAAASLFYFRYPDYDYVPVNYRAMPELSPEYDTVIFVDFTPPIPWVEQYKAQLKSLTILDHHDDKREDLDLIAMKFPEAVIQFSQARSGAGLTWDYLSEGETPYVIELISRRDLWVSTPEERIYHELFVLYLKKGDKDEIFPPFGEIAFLTKGEVIATLKPQAELLIKARDKNIQFHLDKMIVKEGSVIQNQRLLPLKVAYGNPPYYYASEFSAKVMEQNSDIDLILCITLNKKGLGVSARSRKGTGWAQLFCTEFFNGGGHPDASGGVISDVKSFDEIHQMIFGGNNV